MKHESTPDDWLDALEALDPEPIDSGQRKRHLKWEGERLRSMLRIAQGSQWGKVASHS